MGLNTENHTEAKAWKQFWTGRAAGSEHRFRDAGTAGRLQSHWSAVLADALPASGQVDLIDLACGEGEVLQLAARVAGSLPDVRLNAVVSDVSLDAVSLAAASVGQLDANAAVADCAQLPFASSSFDVVVSQFGLEYAGPAAFGEAGRIVRPSGRFNALVHVAGGAVEHACQADADVLEAVVGAELLDRMRDYVITIPKAVSGSVSREDGQACADALRQALETVARTVGPAAPGPARDFVGRLVQDIQAAAGRLGAYRTEDLEAWIAGQAAELDAFHHRMTSMLRVAQTEADMSALAGQLSAGGLSVTRVGTVSMGEGGAPLAWVLDARRAE
ncbi:class I SAM-dependent methyltransferase [Maricaulis parjimensis]|uniref:class I SAM-dependent methyltransferase n=1 Tax=Maricaulis parjimensis TaxID=144023 RepID=UPI00193A96B6|nr:class I SAM-dependent methyltransferase [Maricaulis parjimensis]